MKSRTIILALLIWWLTSSAVAQVSFIGNSRPVFDEVPAATTGLSHIYVLYDTQGVSMTYTASTDRTVVWYTFGEQGGGYAQERTDIVYDGRLSTLPQVEADCGYIIDEGTDRICVWVTDYSKGYLHLNGLSADNAAGDCGTATLNVAGSGEDLVYYTTGGVRHTLDRGMTLIYNTLEWNDTTQWREPVVIEENVASFKNTIVVPAPYCNTSFHLSRDRFLTFWKEGNDVWSDTYVTTAVNVHAQAVQDEREYDNEKKEQGGTTLGGSAPVHIVFTAHCTDAVVHKEWQMSRDSEFSDIELRLNQEEVDETFEDAGITYWRFIGSNADGSCEAYSDVYTVSIGVSELECPNVFSPGSTPEVNDVWKVSYKSIVDFDCWIFNRWGQQIIHLTHPSQGWDGTYHGKLVSAGVYYYVIRARGSDDHQYKLSGDINIIRYKSNPHSGGYDSGGNESTDDDTTVTDGDKKE